MTTSIAGAESSQAHSGTARWLPRGATLTDTEFAARHRLISWLLYLHLPLVLLVAGINGHLGHPTMWVLLALLGVMSAVGRFARSMTVRASGTALALMLAASVLLHAGGGSTHLHIWFYVVFVSVALYQLWVPFVLAVAFVAVHHIVMSLMNPQMVFSDQAAQDNPLPYALLHAVFLLVEAGLLAYSWRFTESAEQARAAERERADQTERVRAEAELAAARHREEENAARAQEADARATRSAALAAGLADLRTDGADLTERADAAMASMDSLVQAINLIAQASGQAETTVRQAENTSREVMDTIGRLRTTMTDINAIAGAIEGVAEQTNLLALNATIEAARAGDAGKGFAVVAGEVKELADETKGATERIRAVVESVGLEVASTASAIETIQQVIEQVVHAQHTIAEAVQEQNQAASAGKAAIEAATGDAHAISGRLQELAAQD